MKMVERYSHALPPASTGENRLWRLRGVCGTVARMKLFKVNRKDNWSAMEIEICWGGLAVIILIWTVLGFAVHALDRMIFG